MRAKSVMDVRAAPANALVDVRIDWHRVAQQLSSSIDSNPRTNGLQLGVDFIKTVVQDLFAKSPHPAVVRIRVGVEIVAVGGAVPRTVRLMDYHPPSGSVNVEVWLHQSVRVILHLTIGPPGSLLRMHDALFDAVRRMFETYPHNQPQDVVGIRYSGDRSNFRRRFERVKALYAHTPAPQSPTDKILYCLDCIVKSTIRQLVSVRVCTDMARSLEPETFPADQAVLDGIESLCADGYILRSMVHRYGSFAAVSITPAGHSRIARLIAPYQSPSA